MGDQGRRTPMSATELVAKALRDLELPGKVIGQVEGLAFTKVQVEIPASIEPDIFARCAKRLGLQLKMGVIPLIRPDYADGTMVIEVPNEKREFINCLDIILNNEWQVQSKGLAVPLIIGVTAERKLFTIDLATLPHLLVAGTTGSGKSCALKSMIDGLLHSFYNANDYILHLIDPKAVEFLKYKDNVNVRYVADFSEAANLLRDLVGEMETRLKVVFPKEGVSSYGELKTKMRRHVVFIDELADFLINEPDAERLIVLLAQKGRAAGIHLVLATQRPSADVLSGLIRANVPARLCLRVASKMDSKVVFGSSGHGAENLMGKGDALYLGPDATFPIRVQCPLA